MISASAAVRKVQKRVQFTTRLFLGGIIVFAFFHLSSKTDPLIVWRKRFITSFAITKGDDFAKMHAAAVENPLPDAKGIEEQLTRDLRAGQLLLSDKAISEALRILIGVERGTFIGTGANPSEKSEFVYGRYRSREIGD
jgi:hypothetical protein